MVLSEEEEYIAESRDATPEPTMEVIETGQGLTPTHGILKKTMENGESADGESKVIDGECIKKEERVPDMQLGKCRYVRLHDNVNYVAAGIALRGEGKETEVLLIEEAKKSCKGKWYLPAGRVEAGETLTESVQREFIEESGYTCDVIQLVALDVQGSGWYRFAFYCQVTGGHLKTVSDPESLSANWFLVSDLFSAKRNFPVRGRDFFGLVKSAVSFRDTLSSSPSLPPILPLNINMPGLFVEFMIVKHNRDGSRTEVLVHKSVSDESVLAIHDQPFPTVEFGFEYFFAMVVSKCYRHLLDEGANVVFAPSHVTRVKCHPAPLQSLQHGLAVRVYCEHKLCTKAVIRSPRYHWILVENEATLSAFHLHKKQFRASLNML